MITKKKCTDVRADKLQNCDEIAAGCNFSGTKITLIGSCDKNRLCKGALKSNTDFKISRFYLTQVESQFIPCSFNVLLEFSDRFLHIAKFPFHVSSL